MRRAEAQRVVSLPPADAVRLWSDLRRWASFVEGFARVSETSGGWPAEGAKVTWESTPGGRGRVTERVSASTADRFATQVFEERLSGEQTFRAQAAPGEDGRAVVSLVLEYELSGGGPFRGLTDVLFIRRALRDALGRTLRRFAVEAEEEAGVR